MKKLSVVLLAVLVSMATMAAPVDAQRARQVALTAAKLYSWELSQQNKARMNPNAECLLKDVTAEVGISHIYVFNYAIADGNREGFVVVSGDDAAAPVLAFSDEGALEMNPAVRFHLEQYSHQIASAQEAGTCASKVLQHKWEQLASGKAINEAVQRFEAKGDLYNDNINRLLGGMVWGQSDPYNRRCPGGSVTGCVATAFGMIMNYWDYPEHGFGQHSYNGEDNPAAYPGWNYGELTADFEHTYYDWANMEDYAYINSPEEVKTAIGTLMFHIGVALDMRYGENASGCWSLPEYAIYDTSLHLDPKISAPYRIPKHFGYKFSYAGMRDSIGSDTLWMQMLYQSLADSMPIYYAGWERDSSDDGHSGTSGHGYILDGYFSDEVDSNLFHINWGWDGNNNGLFKLDAMTPSGYDFTQWHGAVIGLEPDTSYHGYDPAAIPMPSMAMPKVFSRNGHIVADGIDGQATAVFDMMGRCVATRPAHQGNTWSLHVRPGIYVVRIGQLPAQKVIVINN